MGNETNFSRTTSGLETWEVRKPAVRGGAGLVASQHHVASEVGARTLAAGGNAVDAAVAAGLAIGAVVPFALDDLATYAARALDAEVVRYRDARVSAA